jgi:NAD-dependent aldehyde dehydrogenases
LKARAGSAADPRRQRQFAGRSERPHAPFGGYKQSGNGREWGKYGWKNISK